MRVVYSGAATDRRNCKYMYFGPLRASSAATSCCCSLRSESYDFHDPRYLSEVTEDWDIWEMENRYVRRYASTVMTANLNSTERVDSSTARYFAPFAIKAQLAPRSLSVTSSSPSSWARLWVSLNPCPSL